MLEFEILARGLYRSDQLDITYDPSLRMPTTGTMGECTIQEWIDAVWQEKLALAHTQGVPLYDSLLFRLVSAEALPPPMMTALPPMMTARVITTIHDSGSLSLADSHRGNERSDVPVVYSSDDPCGHHEGRGHHEGQGGHHGRSDGKLKLVLGDTGYKEYTVTRQPEFFVGRNRQELSNPLAVCSVIETSDGFILYEKRQNVAVHVGRYHVIGGFFERDRDIDADGKPDPFGAICREISEETGIQVEDIAEQYCLGAVYDVGTPHGELCFLTKLHIPLDEVCRRTPKDHEIQHLLSLYVTEESLREFVLNNHGNISATGEPNLLMYGGVRFGEGWLGEVMGRLM